MAPIKISEEDKKAANLRALQKADADVIEIVASASHSVLYGFNISSASWEKRNVEGAYFPNAVNLCDLCDLLVQFLSHRRIYEYRVSLYC
jgi:hypothetical protein